MRQAPPSSVYGPVRSWRLGASLGVDLLCVDSICSFACVYCQLGKINRLTTERACFVSTAKVLEDLQKSDWQSAQVITFSGSGEPTLAVNLGEAIEKTNRLTHKPTVVLTNSTLLQDAQVRREISTADKIFCKLDAWSGERLRRVDRPHRDVSFESIITGISQLRREFDRFLAIQTMILKKPKDFEIEKLAAILDAIRPDEVQLNLPTRPVPREYFTETRGNAVECAPEFTRIKTISKSEIENVRAQLSQLTNLPVTARF